MTRYSTNGRNWKRHTSFRFKAFPGMRIPRSVCESNTMSLLFHVNKGTLGKIFCRTRATVTELVSNLQIIYPRERSFLQKKT